MTDESTMRLQNLVLAPGPALLGPTRRPGVLSAAALEKELEFTLNLAPIPPAKGDLVRALLLLWHDHLDAAHTISQGIENREGSLVHAIMHRREPDYWNSKYWWRRVGEHPCFAELAKRVSALLAARQEAELSARLVPRGRWDAFAFVDACEAAAKDVAGSSRVTLLGEIQQLESQVALRHFLRGLVELQFALP